MSDASMELMKLFLKQKKEEEYYGTVELTFQEGEVKQIRENSTMPIAAYAAESWEKLSEEVKQELREKFKDVKSFKSKVPS
jgi:hypothetical protein